MAETREITVRVLRANPLAGDEPHHETYQVSVAPGTSVADLLRELNRQHDGGVAYRVSCRRGVCGVCTVKVNGRPRLACCTEARGDVSLEPAFPDNVVKDLVSQAKAGKQEGGDARRRVRHRGFHDGSLDRCNGGDRDLDKPAAPDASEVTRATPPFPAGGVPLSQERLQLLAPAWEATYRTLRRMDELELGEVEPATLFVWRLEQP